MPADPHGPVRTRLAQSPRLQQARLAVARALLAVHDRLPTRSFDRLSSARALRLAYNVVLAREPDRNGALFYFTQMISRNMDRRDLVEALRGSEEYNARVGFRGRSLKYSLHASRCAFVRSLPPASHILDLGGTHLASNLGAMVEMGYPYPFDELVVVDLAPDERHPIYHQRSAASSVASERGRVTYRFHSMTDLSDYEDASFDLAYMGQSIEHITPPEAGALLPQLLRVLRPGGFLALDTPNGRATRLHQADFIDPDHKVEYTHAELSGMLEAAGFEVVEAKGLNYLGASFAAGRFSADDAAGHPGLHAAIDDCYLLAYVCRRPSP